MTSRPTRYRSDDEDSSRWIDFPFRRGDIVISTRSKSGTTWMQMICALLILRTPDLPRPLAALSPWLDWLGTPRDDVVGALEAQEHRRFIKTHTPLDGLPLDHRATYIVVGRHPLDMAVSLYHQGTNLNRDRLRQLTGDPGPLLRPQQRPAAGDWLRAWIEGDGPPSEQLDSLPGVMWHLSDAWNRRHCANIVLVHYADLAADLEGEMHRLAAALGIAVRRDESAKLATAASFEAMRANSAWIAPDPGGVLEDHAAFFRRGTSGAGAELLSPADVVRYEARASELAPDDLLDWLHR